MQELINALIKAQSEMDVAIKTGENPHFKSDYAPLDEVIKAVKKPLNDNGIFFLQKVYPADKGQCVETEFHGHGAVLTGGKVFVVADKTTPMGYGSALTYAKRYSLQTACGIPSGDDDGNEAEENFDEENLNLDEPATIKVDDRQTVLSQDKPQDDDEIKDEAMATAFVEGFMKVASAFKTGDDVRNLYKSNKKINVLKSKFPEHKEMLDKRIVEYVNQLDKEEKDG